MLSLNGWAQQEIPVAIRLIDAEQLPFQFKKNSRDVNPVELSYRAEALLEDLHIAGYATASIDSFYVQRDTGFIEIFLGERFQIERINFNEAAQTLLEEVDLKSKWNTKQALEKGKYSDDVDIFKFR